MLLQGPAAFLNEALELGAKCRATRDVALCEVVLQTSQQVELGAGVLGPVDQRPVRLRA
jgi:hypothetical protein